MRYELWGLHPGNLIGTFPSEAAALAEVRGLLAAGWDANDLSLGHIDGTVRGFVAEGEALAVLIRASEEGT